MHCALRKRVESCWKDNTGAQAVRSVKVPSSLLLRLEWTSSSELDTLSISRFQCDQKPFGHAIVTEAKAGWWQVSHLIQLYQSNGMAGPLQPRIRFEAPRHERQRRQAARGAADFDAGRARRWSPSALMGVQRS